MRFGREASDVEGHVIPAKRGREKTSLHRLPAVFLSTTTNSRRVQFHFNNHVVHST